MINRHSLTSVVGLVIACGIGFFVARWTSADASRAEATRTAEVHASLVSAMEAEANLASRPLIGIASYGSATYMRAIRESGGVPVVLPNTDGEVVQLKQYLQILDGLVMPGGADIPPSEWGEELHPTTNLIDDERYRFEKALIEAWIDQTDKPLLGICLGSQWINVAHGGSLIQDIPSEFGVNHKGTTHPVELDPSSRLKQIFGESEFEVNSLHHQAVRRVGKNLKAVARSPDGIIEATESIAPDRFLIGVQWHPEKMMPEDRVQARIFQAFIKACDNSACPQPSDSESSYSKSSDSGLGDSERGDSEESEDVEVNGNSQPRQPRAVSKQSNRETSNEDRTAPTNE